MTSSRACTCVRHAPAAPAELYNKNIDQATVDALRASYQKEASAAAVARADARACMRVRL